MLWSHCVPANNASVGVLGSFYRNGISLIWCFMWFCLHLPYYDRYWYQKIEWYCTVWSNPIRAHLGEHHVRIATFCPRSVRCTQKPFDSAHGSRTVMLLRTYAHGSGVEAQKYASGSSYTHEAWTVTGLAQITADVRQTRVKMGLTLTSCTVRNSEHSSSTKYRTRFSDIL